MVTLRLFETSVGICPEYMVLSHKNNLFLGAFAILRKATINFVVSVCLSVYPSIRMEQLGSHWTNFH